MCSSTDRTERLESSELPWAAGLSFLLAGILVLALGSSSFGVDGAEGSIDRATAFDLQQPLTELLLERMRSGQSALWNSRVGLGHPLSANPALGWFDPGVRLLAWAPAQLAEALRAALAVAQLALASLGAYLLAHRLSIGRPGAILAAVGCSTSGFFLAGVGLPASRSAFLLPWLLLGLEGLRSGRPGLAFCWTALVAWLVGLAAAPQVCGFFLLAAFAWTTSLLERDRIAGRTGLLALTCGTLMAAPSWLPYLEYLSLAPRSGGAAPGEVPDLASLGALLLCAYLLSTLSVRELGQRVTTVASALLVCALVLFLQRRGWQLAAFSGEWGGSGWLALPVWLLALSGGLSAWPGSRGLVLAAVLSSLVATSAPGVRDLVRLLPAGASIDAAAAGGLVALFVPLLAGAALERGTPRARGAAALTGLFLFGVSWAGQTGEPAGAQVSSAPDDEVFSYEVLPPTAWSGGPAELRGVLHGDLDLDRLTLYLEELGGDGTVVGAPRFVAAADLGPLQASGDRTFSFEDLGLIELSPGTWRTRLEVRRGARLLGTRHPSTLVVERAVAPLSLRLSLLLLTLLLLMGWLPAREGSAAGALVRWGWAPALTLGSAFLVPLLQVPRASPRSSRLPLTEAFLRSQPVGTRVVAPGDVLPGARCLSSGVAKVNAADGVGLALFERAQSAMVAPGVDVQAAWRDGAVDLGSEAFRALGVELLLRHEPLDSEEWELVARPGEATGTAQAEVFVYRARSPAPRAFCARSTRAASGDVFAQSRRVPSSTALLGEELRVELASPFEHSSVIALGDAEEESTYEVSLDGEAVFVVSDQFLPGWTVSVDGSPRQLLRIRGALRGVHLEAGEHLVRFHYEPNGPRWARWLALLGLTLFLGWSAILGRLSLPGGGGRR